LLPPGLRRALTETNVATSLLALLDDIASILDDVAAMTKVATKKTAGVLGDDLALNAEQVTGVKADRELPVVWAVAVGSLKNKAILVPAALVIVAVAPWLVTPLLMIGGAFLCFEGFEKVAHKLLHPPQERAAEHRQLVEAVANPAVDLVALEKEKIKGAVRTDFILSAEIIIISLGTIAATASFGSKVMVLVGISLVMTIGVYGLVAGIVKLDDAGQALQKKESSGARAFGRGLLIGAPYLMKFLSIAGTVAMFLVGGGIIAHGIHAIGDFGTALAARVAATPGVGGVLGWLASTLVEGITGVVAGGIIVAVVTLVKRFLKKPQATAQTAEPAAKVETPPGASQS
jgi:predicted DNA repair protein MutK